jgi:hypothetical protein
MANKGILELLEFALAQPSSTSVNSAVPSSEDFLENRTKNLANIVGSIQQTPFYETKEGMQTILDLVTGMGGGAIGRVSKAAITGGQYATGTLKKGLKDWLKRNVPKGQFPRGVMKNPNIAPKAPGKRYKDFSEFEWDNKLNAARLRAEKAFDKYNISHEEEMVDPVTILLDLLKRN